MTNAPTPQYLFTNARFATMDPARPEARAMLVRDGRIVALGDHDELSNQAPDAFWEDLRGRFVCPGFVDAHNHFSLTALEVGSVGAVDCRTPPVSSIADLQDRIRDHARTVPSGRWVRGHGYDDAALGRHPTRADLDAVAPDFPLVLVHWSVHRCVANSAALNAAGIDDSTPDPPGGWAVRDAAGRLTGLLYERASDPVQAASIGAAGDASWNSLPLTLSINQSLMHRVGVTAVGDAYVHPKLAAAYREWYRQQVKHGERTAARLHVRPFCGSEAGLFAQPVGCIQPTPPDSAASVLPAGIKIFADGGGNTTATSLASGRPPRFLFYSQDALNDLVAGAHASAMPVAIHAAGDIAVSMALDAFEHARRAHPAIEPRFRIEHAITVKAADIPRLRSLDVSLVTQPEAVFHSGARLAQAGLAEGVRVAPYRDLLDAGTTLAFSSDSPCYALPPLWQMWCATTRATAEGAALPDGQAVTAAEALIAYTRTGAAAIFDDGGGVLAPGKRADFVALSEDPRSGPPSRWSDISVETVYVAGRWEGPVAIDRLPLPGRPVPLP